MSAGALSNEKAVKAAAKNVIAVYVDCTEDDQNLDLQKKFNIEGYPTVLIVSPKEKILEDWYPTDGAKFAKDLARIGKKYGPRPWMSTWTEALTYGREDKKTVVVFYIRDKNYKRWDELKGWLQKMNV